MLVCRLHFYVFALALLCSCAKSLSPQEVAAEFWAAVEQGDAAKVKRHITTGQAIEFESLNHLLPISNAQIERTVIEAKTATVDTTVTIDSDKPLNFPLKTHLVLEEQKWKIDYERTMAAVDNAGKLATVISKVHEFGNALQQGIDRSIQEFESTLPQIEQELSRIESQIKHHVPELRKRIENFTKELEKAIKTPPKNNETPPQVNEPIQI
jgi:hypothetical protein